MYRTFSEVTPGHRVHFIGIGGVSMSALATILLSKGYHITGSDASRSLYTDRLETRGAHISFGHRAENVVGSDVVIYSSAIGPDNPERVFADTHGILSLERSALLGEIERMYRYPIDVAGTHGKTSTTGMLTHIFMEAALDPTVLIGGDLAVLDGNMRIGATDYFLSEACEYHRSFLDFHPYLAIILDIEADHLDYYKDLDDIKKAFCDFAHLASGGVILNIDDKGVNDIAPRINRPLITVSHKTSTADFYANALSVDENGCYAFDVYDKSGFLARAALQVPGLHHVGNALCAFAAAASLGISPATIAQGLAAFHGVKRRFELKGEKRGVRIYDDYAHHPTEIRATLEALAHLNAPNKYIVFQPHTYSRTLTLFDDFIAALSTAPHVIITDIYAAREKDNGKISALQLANAISGAHYAKTFEDAVSYLSAHVSDGDIVITVGAGNVYQIGEELLRRLS